MLKIWVFGWMHSHFSCCTEKHFTFTANIRLHTFTTTYMYLKADKANALDVFLLTNVTCEPSTFIVWLQQMWLELVNLCKTSWIMSTWVRLCTSVSINMLLQFTTTFTQLLTVMTVIRSSVAVYTTFVSPNCRTDKTFFCQWTLVWLLNCFFTFKQVDSHVNV